MTHANEQYQHLKSFSRAESREVTYLDAVQYGLGSTFRSRLSDLRKTHEIESWDKTVPTRYGMHATVKAHRLAGGAA